MEIHKSSAYPKLERTRKKYVKFIKKRFELMDKIVQEKEEINAIEETKAEVNSAVDIISVIAKIMLADGVVTQSELDEYKKMCKKYEIDAEKALSIFNAVKANEIEISLEHKKGKKIAYDTLDAIIEMAMSDGVIQDEEKSIIMEYGKKLGFSPLDIKMKTRSYLTEEQKQEIRNSL